MITILLSMLVVVFFTGRHWTNFLGGGFIGAVIAVAIGFFVPKESSQNFPFEGTTINHIPSFNWIEYHYIDSNNRICTKTFDIKDVELGEHDSIFCVRTYPKMEHFYWMIQIPEWEIHCTISKETAKKIGVL